MSSTIWGALFPVIRGIEHRGTVMPGRSELSRRCVDCEPARLRRRQRAGLTHYRVPRAHPTWVRAVTRAVLAVAVWLLASGVLTLLALVWRWAGTY